MYQNTPHVPDLQSWISRYPRTQKPPVRAYQHRQLHSKHPSIVTANPQSGRLWKPHCSSRCTDRPWRGARFACESSIATSSVKSHRPPVLGRRIRYTPLANPLGTSPSVPKPNYQYQILSTDIAPTYRNACESPRKHVSTKAIVRREGFVAVKDKTELACTIHRGPEEPEGREKPPRTSGTAHIRRRGRMTPKPRYQYWRHASSHYP